MSFWRTAVLALAFFIVFLYFLERMMQTTFEKAVALEAFADRNNKKKKKKKCSDFFVAIPQDLQLFENCKVTDKANSRCDTLTHKEFCNKLLENGWNKSWTKKQLAKRKDDAEIKKVYQKIKNNLGLVTEKQIQSCFPTYF